MTSPQDNNEKLPLLTAKQKRFCEEYVIDLNATQAAIRALYSEKTARQMGTENLSKPVIKNYIAELLVKKQMTGDEAVKLIGDIAKTSLNDYFIVKKVEYTPRVEMPLQQVIDALQAEIDFEWEFALLAELDDKEQEAYEKEQKYRKRKLLRYKLELKNNPKATRIVDGQPVMREQAELDLVKLVRDKERGRIKSFAYGQFGPKVEMYAADGALMNVAKITGKVMEKIDHTTKGEKLKAVASPIMFIPADQLTPEQIEKYLADAAGPSDESLS